LRIRVFPFKIIGMHYSLSVLIGFSLLMSACGNADRSTFPGDPSYPLFLMDPREYCKQAEDGSFDGETVTIDSGEEDKYVWSQGGGCIKRPILDVWGATHNFDLMLWDGVDSYKLLVGEPPEKVSHFYEAYYVVNDFITVTWTMQWYHSVGFGTKADPEFLIINYKRVAGTQYIPYWEGSILLEKIEPGVTAIAVRNQIDAAQTGVEDSISAIEDIVYKLRTGVPVKIP